MHNVTRRFCRKVIRHIWHKHWTECTYVYKDLFQFHIYYNILRFTVTDSATAGFKTIDQNRPIHTHALSFSPGMQPNNGAHYTLFAMLT